MSRTYLDQLLTGDAGVIADDENHVLVSVRLDKRWLSQNHGLLLALSELAGTSKNQRRPARRDPGDSPSSPTG